MCENLVCALKLLANKQLGGDCPVDVLVEELQVRSRLKMMEELRRFTMVDRHEAVTIGDLERTLVTVQVVEPKFGDFPENSGS